MMLFFLLAGSPSTDLPALARYESAMLAAHGLSVKVTAKLAPTGTTGVGRLTFERPSSVRFEMTVNGKRYLYGANGKQGVEIDFAEELYDEFAGNPGLAIAPSSLSSIPAIGVPDALLHSNMRQALGPAATFKSAGQLAIDGVTTDVVSGHDEDPRSVTDVTAYIDPKGLLRRFHVVRASGNGTFDVTYDLTDYQINKPTPAGAFTPQIPVGYVPYSIPMADPPVESGQPVAFGTWQLASSGRPVDVDAVVRGRVSLVALVDPAGESSVEALHALDAPARRLLGKDGRYVVISTSSDLAASKGLPVNGVAFDPTGKALRALAYPGAPLIYLIGKDGKVVQAWLGFDRNQRKAFLDEVDEAFGRADVE